MPQDVAQGADDGALASAVDDGEQLAHAVEAELADPDSRGGT